MFLSVLDSRHVLLCFQNRTQKKRSGLALSLSMINSGEKEWECKC